MYETRLRSSVGANGHSAWRGLVTIDELIDPRLCIVYGRLINTSPNFTARNDVGVGKMPRRWCMLGVLDRQEIQRHRICRHRQCRRRAALQGATGATRPQSCPQRRCAHSRILMTWRVPELYGAQWHRRRRRCREDGLQGGSSVGHCLFFLSNTAHTSEGRSTFNSFARVRYLHTLRWPYPFATTKLGAHKCQMAAVTKRYVSHWLLGQTS
jgi:hypothetical protein